MKYECIETFSFENCCFGDDDKAEEYMTVVAGPVWQTLWIVGLIVMMIVGWMK